MKINEVDKATDHKQRLEQRQREEARDRKERGVAWETKVVGLVIKVTKVGRACYQGNEGRRGLLSR